ncbi:MAG: hypothetical protein ACLFUS_13020 [Candidatus Sumerlaeia bacterium]
MTVQSASQHPASMPDSPDAGADKSVDTQDKKPSPPRKKRWRRRFLYIFGSFLLLLVIFALWLKLRSGREYYGTPERLLPADTALLTTWRAFSLFLQDFESLEAVRSMKQDEELASLLAADTEWLSLQKRMSKAQYRIVQKMFRDFVDTWFGREFSIAILPPVEKYPDNNFPKRSGLIVIARTDIGFEENLAELAMQLYPEFRLKEYKHREQSIFAYQAEKEFDGFAYCRFGKTVVITLRSADPRWLMEIVDRKVDDESGKHEEKSLAATVNFRHAAKWEKEATPGGLRLFLNPAVLPQTMRRYPFDDADGDIFMFWMEYIKEKWNKFEWAAMKMNLKDGLHMNSKWQLKPEAEAEWRKALKGPEIMPPMAELLGQMPPDTSVVYQAAHPSLRDFMLELRDRMARSGAYREKLAKFEAAWQNALGLRYREDCLAKLGEGFGLALTGLVGGDIFPVPLGRGWWDHDSEAAARENARTIDNNEITADRILLMLFARYHSRVEGRRVWLYLNETENASWQEGNTRLPEIYQKQLPELPRQSPAFAMIVDLEQAYLQLRKVHNAARLWSRKVRKNFHRLETALAALQHLSSARFIIYHEEDGVRFSLHVDAR